MNMNNQIELAHRLKENLDKSFLDFSNLYAEIVYNSFKEPGNIIKFKTFYELDEGIEYSLAALKDGTIIFSILKQSLTRILSHARFSNGATLGLHKHEDLKEIIKVNKGSLKFHFKTEEKEWNQTINEGEEIEISKDIWHQVHALTESELTTILQEI